MTTQFIPPRDGIASRDPLQPRMVRRHILVTGLVQGVGFRYEALRAARRLGLTGWVRNNPDGSVELEAQGDSRSVEEFIDLLWQGPRWSRVDDVRIEPQNPVPPSYGETTFYVTR